MFLLERSGKLRVSLNGSEFRFDASGVTKIIATLDAGDDSFEMNTALSLPTTVFGGDGADTISTARGDDRVEGGAGNDSLRTGLGNDRAYGGDDYDTVSYANDQMAVDADVNVQAEEGPEFVFGIVTSGLIKRGAELDKTFGTERFIATAGGDRIRFNVTTGAMISNWSGGIFSVDAGAGDDRITLVGDNALSRGVEGAAFLEEVIGGEGDDDLIVGSSSGTANFDPGPGVDHLFLDPWFFTFDYVMPDDLENLTAHKASTYTITGNTLDNLIRIAQGGAKDVFGLAGDDQIYVDGSASNFGDGIRGLHGGDGNDLIEISHVLDTPVAYNANGNAGNDTIRGAGGDDTLYGGDGDDRLYGNAISSFTRGLLAYGGAGNDSIYGTTIDDTLFGDAGNDRIFAGDGADRLYGGEGNDILDGRAGRDRLYGEGGKDRGVRESIDRTFASIEVLL